MTVSGHQEEKKSHEEHQLLVTHVDVDVVNYVFISMAGFIYTLCITIDSIWFNKKRTMTKCHINVNKEEQD